MQLQNLNSTKMINSINIQQHKRLPKSLLSLKVSSMILSTFLLGGMLNPQKATAQTTPQEEITMPSWWFGIAGGANFNFYSGSTQKINDDLMARSAFGKGQGIGLFAGPTIAYYKPNSLFGFMLQAAYDTKSGKFAEVLTPCDCPADLNTKLNYIVIEPSLRFAPFRSNFYLFGGPRFSFNIDKSFVFQQSTNPAFPDQIPSDEITGDMSDVRKTMISMQVGAGYDIPLSSKTNRNQFILSPFVSYQPYLGQNPRTIETWDVSTVRIGAIIQFGRGFLPSDSEKETAKPVVIPVPVTVIPEEIVPAFQFSVNAPANIPLERTVRETFPLRNYVFFDLGSTQIPERYVLLKKPQVADFKEDNVELFTPQNLSGRSDRQMIVYYNVLNILGDRMSKNPTSNITLVGSSESGVENGLQMSESIKKYLVDVFAIAPNRITTQGRNEPKIPSRQTGGTEELVLLAEGDRRVTIESNAPALLMEFGSGPKTPLKPVTILDVNEAPSESYVNFNNKGSDEAFTSWSMEIKGPDGIVQNHGPYTQENVVLPGKTIMGTNPQGKYNVKMTGITAENNFETKDTTVEMTLWTPTKNEVAMRFSVIYEFNESNAIGLYDKYLKEVIVPKIPQNAKVILQGYTDIIGNANYNQRLSLQRANDVKNTIQTELTRLGRKDVKIEVYGIGEDNNLSPFGNKYPEERFYNRAVLIDIVPAKN